MVLYQSEMFLIALYVFKKNYLTQVTQGLLRMQIGILT